MKLARRDAIKTALALCAAAAVPGVSRPARALGAPKKLVIVLASGGWDPTYALDPKPGQSGVDGPDGVLETVGGIPILTHASRPSVTTFFERYGSITSLVNGLLVRSFVHSDCMKRVMTGTPSDQKADIGAIAASELGAELPVPYLVLGNSALSGPLASLTARAGTSNQLSGLLSPDPFASAYPAEFSPTDAERARAKAWADGSTERLLSTRGTSVENQKELAAFKKALERRDLLRAFAESSGGFGKRDYTPDLDVQVQVALDALSGGLCQSVMLELSDWDTHQGNSRQASQFESFFAGLVALTEGLEAKKLLSETVVMVLSEMGRTPKLNSSQGKDHWPVTSALVYGAGVRGKSVLGGTDAQLGALPVDFVSGATGSGTQLQTGNFLAGVLSLVGVDPAPHLPNMEPFDALGA